MPSRQLSDFADFTLHHILGFVDGKDIICFRMSCKRFEKCVGDVFMIKLMEVRTGLPQMVYKKRYSIQSALKQLIWKGKLTRSAFNEDEMVLHFESFKISSNQNLMFLASAFDMDEQYLIQTASYRYPASPNRFIPAVVRDASTFQIVGFLPYQNAFEIAIFNSSKLGKVAITFNALGIFATRIENNLFATVEEMENSKGSQAQVSKTIFSFQGKGIECSTFGKGKLLWADSSTIWITEPTDEVFDHETKDQLKDFQEFKCTTKGRILDAAIDPDLNIVTCVDSLGQVFIWNLDNPSRVETMDFSDIFDEALRVGTDLIALMRSQDGFIVIQTNHAKYGVLKWNGKEFERWRLYTDPSRTKYINRDLANVNKTIFFALSCGILAAPDAQGLGIYFWNLMDPLSSEVGHFQKITKELGFKKDGQYPRVGSVMFSVEWTPDGSSLLYSSSTSKPHFARVDLSRTNNQTAESKSSWDLNNSNFSNTFIEEAD
jgi:hypothetical protein